MVPGLILCNEGYEAEAWDLGVLVLKIYRIERYNVQSTPFRDVCAGLEHMTQHWTKQLVVHEVKTSPHMLSYIRLSELYFARYSQCFRNKGQFAGTSTEGNVPQGSDYSLFCKIS